MKGLAAFAVAFVVALGTGMVAPVAAAPQPERMPAPLGDRLDFIAAGAPSTTWQSRW